MSPLERRAHRCVQFGEHATGVRRAFWYGRAAVLFRRSADEGGTLARENARHAEAYAEAAALEWRAFVDDCRVHVMALSTAGGSR